MIEKAIYTLLNSGGTGAQVSYGTLSVDDSGSANTFTDYIVFFRNSTDPHDTKSGRSTLDTAQIQVNCFSRTALGSANLAEKVRNLLDRKVAGTYGTVKVQSINFTNMVSMFEFNESYSAKGVFQMSLFYDCRFEPVYQ